jgi:hypothetical protein
MIGRSEMALSERAINEINYCEQGFEDFAKKHKNIWRLNTKDGREA